MHLRIRHYQNQWLLIVNLSHVNEFNKIEINNKFPSTKLIQKCRLPNCDHFVSTLNVEIMAFAHCVAVNLEHIEMQIQCK